MYSWKGLSFLASTIGEPKRLHPDTEQCKSFEEARILVEVDLTKKLPEQYSFQSNKSVNEVVQYEYPWLPPRCSVFSKWGHTTNECLANKKKILTKEKEIMVQEQTTSCSESATVVTPETNIEDDHVDKEAALPPTENVNQDVTIEEVSQEHNNIQLQRDEQ